MRFIRRDRSPGDRPLGHEPLDHRAEERKPPADRPDGGRHAGDRPGAEGRRETAEDPPLPQLSDPPRVAVLTTVRDEAQMLPRWLDYYGRQVGSENLLVLDDNSVDGSTKDLPCTVYQLPPAPWRMEWA